MAKPSAASLPEAPRADVRVYGLDLTDYSPRAQFIVLGGGALISALVFAFLQEKVGGGGCPFVIEHTHARTRTHSNMNALVT